MPEEPKLAAARYLKKIPLQKLSLVSEAHPYHRNEATFTGDRVLKLNFGDLPVDIHVKIDGTRLMKPQVANPGKYSPLNRDKTLRRAPYTSLPAPVGVMTQIE